MVSNVLKATNFLVPCMLGHQTTFFGAEYTLGISLRIPSLSEYILRGPFRAEKYSREAIFAAPSMLSASYKNIVAIASCFCGAVARN